MRGVIFWILAIMAVCGGCGDTGGPGTEADRVGVGAACMVDDDCFQSDDDDAPRQECLQQFSGGYCGIEGCVDNWDCPNGAACVVHDDGVNYCFRICRDKVECNLNRPPDAASNCSSNIDYADSITTAKACVPPSSF